jgi:Uma2 family endonuclease
LKLLKFLGPIAESKGLEPLYETGLFRPDSAEADFRVPDLMFARPDRISERGVEGGAELVVELLSEGDESREKLVFYAQLGVAEVLLIDPVTREVELYALRGGQLHLALPDEKGVVRLQLLGVTLGKAAGPKLVAASADGIAASL